MDAPPSQFRFASPRRKLRDDATCHSSLSSARTKHALSFETHTDLYQTLLPSSFSRVRRTNSLLKLTITFLPNLTNVVFVSISPSIYFFRPLLVLDMNEIKISRTFLLDFFYCCGFVFTSFNCVWTCILL